MVMSYFFDYLFRQMAGKKKPKQRFGNGRQIEHVGWGEGPGVVEFGFRVDVFAALMLF